MVWWEESLPAYFDAVVVKEPVGEFSNLSFLHGQPSRESRSGSFY